jgi:hypothetical protein
VIPDGDSPVAIPIRAFWQTTWDDTARQPTTRSALAATCRARHAIFFFFYIFPPQFWKNI